MGQKYTHLSAEERAKIEFEEGNGSSLRSVARRLGRHASSVSRELSRNRSELSPPYSGPSAGAVYRERWWRSVRAFLAAMARIPSWQDQPQHPQSPRPFAERVMEKPVTSFHMITRPNCRPQKNVDGAGGCSFVGLQGKR